MKDGMVATFQFSKEHSHGPVPDGFRAVKQYRTMKRHGTCLSVRIQDSCVPLKDKSVGLVQNIIQDGSRAFIVYRKFASVADLFTFPLASSSLDIVDIASIRATGCLHVL